MTVSFVKATKREAKLRLALAGPPGSGKTFTAIQQAVEIAGQDGRVAVIDTEHGSASKVADRFSFDVLALTDYHPRRYVEAIRAAEQGGYTVLVIDSLSHAWSGSGGVLEQSQKLADTKFKGNSFRAWGEAGAIHNELVNAILSSKLHVIVTMRSKMEYSQERDTNSGKTVVKKLGMAPVQRDDIPYEFDIFGELDLDHVLTLSKSRCAALQGAVIASPGPELAHSLQEWLQGEPANDAAQVSPVSVSSVDDLVPLDVGGKPVFLDLIIEGMGRIAKSGLLSASIYDPNSDSEAMQALDTLEGVRDYCLGQLKLSGSVGSMSDEDQAKVMEWTLYLMKKLGLGDTKGV